MKYGSAGYNNREKAENTCLALYGYKNPNQIPKVKEKSKQTCLERYGAENPYASEKIKAKIKKTNIEKYGVEYTSQNKDIMNKIQTTNLKKYGVVCNLNVDSVKQKIKSFETQSKRANSLKNKPKNSKLEKLFETLLNQLGYEKDIDYICQYKSINYPFMCDFYLINENMYIEINGYWMHNDHPFDENNLDDLNTLSIWKSKSINSIQYKYAIHIWTESDPEKRRYGSKLNYIELWNEDDIYNFINNLKEEKL